jgi:hypothetical protein
LIGYIVLVPFVLIAFEMYMSRFKEYKPTQPGKIVIL